MSDLRKHFLGGLMIKPLSPRFEPGPILQSLEETSKARQGARGHKRAGDQSARARFLTVHTLEHRAVLATAAYESPVCRPIITVPGSPGIHERIPGRPDSADDTLRSALSR